MNGIAKLDAKFVNAFIEAPTEVIKMLSNGEPLFDGASVTLPRRVEDPVSAVIECFGASGELSHLVGLLLPAETMDALVPVLMGDAQRERISKKEKLDALGELANMISGRVQMHLMSEEITTCHLSTPRCISNSGLLNSFFSQKKLHFFLSFKLEDHPFYVQIGVN